MVSVRVPGWQRIVADVAGYPSLGVGWMPIDGALKVVVRAGTWSATMASAAFLASSGGASPGIGREPSRAPGPVVRGMPPTVIAGTWVDQDKRRRLWRYPSRPGAGHCVRFALMP